MKLVILDSYAMNEHDLDWTRVSALVSETVMYPRTKYEELVQRLEGAQIAICNKCNIDENVLQKLPQLRLVAVTATGTDSLDIAACRRHNVAVANVPAYSTHSVAQLTLALLLDICQCPSRHETAMRAGYWQIGVPREYGITPQIELYGKTLGIVGYGAIGRQMAVLGQALGMKVIIHTRTVPVGDARFVDMDSLLRQSEVLTLHCPLTSATRGLIGTAALNNMRKGAILLNTARGALVDEHAVAKALEEGTLAAYGSDAYCIEPIIKANPLLTAPNAYLTPHIAWATTQALARLAEAVTENIEAFLGGKAKNIVN